MTRQQPVTRKSRATGYEVTVGHAHDVGLEYERGYVVWYTICEAHAECCGHDTYRTARWMAADPTAWCETCADNDNTIGGTGDVA